MLARFKIADNAFAFDDAFALNFDNADSAFALIDNVLA
jgi:hypothetical protein